MRISKANRATIDRMTELFREALTEVAEAGFEPHVTFDATGRHFDGPVKHGFAGKTYRINGPLTVTVTGRPLPLHARPAVRT